MGVQKRMGVEGSSRVQSYNKLLQTEGQEQGTGDLFILILDGTG